ncbi:MAG: ParB/RepB/Spo0J family partition protein [Legionellaceae bacterium]|nr:ParB/RepB/Spo0J family partition protein [Legionellaceae bacterium]
MQTTYKHIPIEQLQRGRYQPRQSFDAEGLQDLAQSIQSQGLIEPLIVRDVTHDSASVMVSPSQEGETTIGSHDRYEIIAGERRWRAAMMAGLTEVPCLISDYSDEQAAAVTLIENIQRADLNLIEEATGYQRLIHEFRFSQDDIASLIGKSRSHIANLLRLLTLCPDVQTMLRNQQLSLGHARMLVGLTTNLQKQFADHVMTSNWSVRRLEHEVRASKQVSIISQSPIHDCDRIHLQTALAEYMGAPVEITHDSDQGGVLKIKFFDNDTLSGLLERMGMRYD